MAEKRPKCSKIYCQKRVWSHDPLFCAQHSLLKEEMDKIEEESVSEKDQICKCGHSAAKHVQTGIHPKNGYVCIVRLCPCFSFKFDYIRY
jgi:hypothetical protein